MVKVGIIDASIYEDDIVEALKICNFQGIHSNHGNAVARCICFEHSSVEIVNYVVIGKHDKGKADELIAGIEFCIAEQVDIINISVGIKKISHDSFMLLQKCCEKAYSMGIALIVAGSNDGEISYPAFMENVIIVTEKGLMSNEQKEKRWILEYDSALIASKTTNGDHFISGNSFLCAMTTGMYAAFFDKGYINKERYECERDFCKLWKNLYSDNIVSTRIEAEGGPCEYQYIRLCEQDELDAEFIGRLRPKQVCDLSDMKEVACSKVILGNAGYPINNEIKQTLLKRFLEHRIKLIYAVTPIFNVFERYMIKEKYNILIVNIYL